MHIGIITEGTDQLGIRYEGIWRVLRFLLHELLEQGHECSIFHKRRHSSEIHDFVDLLCRFRHLVHPVVVDDSNTIEPEMDEPQAEILAEMVILTGKRPDIWFNPNPLWSAVQYMSGAKISMFHDFLLHDFPCCYLEEDYKAIMACMENCGRYFDKIVSGSQYVISKHAIEACRIAPEKLTYIPSAPIHYEKFFNGSVRQSHDSTRAAHDLLAGELRVSLSNWLGSKENQLFLHHTVYYPYSSADFIFVSTQNRPHKNLILVAQALKILIRERFDNLTVFTTALINIHGESDVERYLNNHGLLGDFLSVGKLSDHAHAAMYGLAALTVHPSPFEGGFPLPFAESVSVGTPCIIPFSEAYLDFLPEQYWDIVFYDDNPMALVEKISFVKRNREQVLAKQREILEHLSKYTWRDVAKEYDTLMMSATSMT